MTSSKEVNLLQCLYDSPYEDEVRWQGIVRVSITLDREKKQKLSKHIIAVTKHNLFILTKKRCGIECKLSLLELEFLSQVQEADYVLNFKKGRLDKERYLHTRLYVHIHSEAKEIIQVIINSIRRSLRYITIGFPKDYIVFNLNLDFIELEQIETVESLKGSLVASGLLTTYYAICDLRQQKPDYEFISTVETLFYCDRRELDLSLWPVLYESDGSDIFFSVALALQYNTYFESLIIKDISFTQSFKYLPTILKHNITLKKLVVSNLNTTWNADLGGSLVLNEQNQLKVLDLSHNNITDSGVAFLSRTLQSLPHFTALSLSHLNMNPEGVNLVLESMIKNFEFSISLKALDLSSNNFDDKSVKLFNQLLCDIGNQGGVLSRLSVSDVKVPFGKICVNLKKLSNLSYLNLSLNKHEKSSDSELISFIRQSRDLRVLSLKDCDLPIDFIKRVVESCKHNSDLKKFQLDISRNNIGERGAEVLAGVLSTVTNIQVLKLSHMGFDVRGTQLIIESISNGVRELTLKGNLFVDTADGHTEIIKNREIMKPLQQAFIDMLERVSTINCLNLRGTAKYNLGINLAYLFKAFASKNSVAYLDIRDHCCGSRVFEKLCKFLNYNTTIRVVRAEGNNIGMKGYIQARNVLLRSNALVSFQIISPKCVDSASSSISANVLGDIFTQNGLRAMKLSRKQHQILKMQDFKFILDSSISSPRKEPKAEPKAEPKISEQKKLLLRCKTSSSSTRTFSKKNSKLLESKSLTDIPVEPTKAQVHRSKSIQSISRKDSNTFPSDTEETIKLNVFKKDLKKTQKLEPIIDMTPTKKSQVETFPGPNSGTTTSIDQRVETIISSSNCDIKLANAISTVSVLHYDNIEQFAPILEDNPPPSDLPPVPFNPSFPQQHLPPLPKRAPPPLPVASMSVSSGPTSTCQSSSNSEVSPPFSDSLQEDRSFRIKKKEIPNVRRTLATLSVNSASGYDIDNKEKVTLTSESSRRKLLLNSRSLGPSSDKENSEPSSRSRDKDSNPSDDLDAYLQDLALQQFSAFSVKPW
jgi:Ran GTPase-activating protein (RanGAP) involved in mRNA processing and transport